MEDTIELGYDAEPLVTEASVSREEEAEIAEETGELDAVSELVIEFVVPDSVTGQSVVDTEISSVVTCPVGQFLTVDGQDVTV